MAESTRHEQQLIADLMKHPAWPVLTEVIERHEKTTTLALGRKAMKGELTSDHAAEMRGFYRGCRFVLHEVAASFRKVMENDERPVG